MGGDMPASVTYWTGTWDPDKEAISKEINALRTGSRLRAPVVAFSPGNRNRIDLRDRVLTLSSSASVALRGAAAMIEPRGDVTHIFGNLSSWYLFSALGRRPILLTAVDARQPVTGLPNRSIARIVVESEVDVDEWLKTGLSRDHIDVIHPGVDCDYYRPSPLVSDRLTLLFASTPSDPAELEPRGIPLLVELARRRPDVDIVVPWRRWGDVVDAQRAVAALQPPANFRVTFSDVADMRPFYAQAHGTVLCFAGAGKTCPNFVLEGLASGRPCLTTPATGVAGLLERHGAGVVASRDVASLSAGVDRLQSDQAMLSDRARALAETAFDVRRFRLHYERLYEEIALDTAVPRGRAASRRSPAG